MNKELIINSTSSEVEIALLEDKLLVELNKEKSNNEYSVGDIYLGRIKKIMPGLNAMIFTPVPFISLASVRVKDVIQALVAAYMPMGEAAFPFEPAPYKLTNVPSLRSNMKCRAACVP